MPFAIKFITHGTNPKTRYYSQTIQSLNAMNGFENLILLTDGSDPEEVDISRTLVEAEIKAESFQGKYPADIKLKIVEFPEPKEKVVSDHD